jgi:hypothetical protein
MGEGRSPSDRAVAVKNGRPESDHSGWDRLTGTRERECEKSGEIGR